MPADLSRFGPGAVSRGYNTYGEYGDWRRRDNRAQTWKNIGRAGLIIGGPMAAMYAAGAGGAAAASVPGAVGASSAPLGVGGVSAGAAGGGAATSGAGAAATAGRVGTASRIGSMFNSKGMELGVNSGMALLANRSQNRAADQARADTLRANAEALALQRQQMENELRNADLDRADAKAAQEAMNELKRRELAASEEERAYTRSLLEQREARLAPIRQRGAQALDRLSSMWRM